MARRAKGEGSITQRKDGRWEGRITLDADISGRRRRRTFYGTTRADVVRRVRDALKKQDDNLPIPGERETLGAFLSTWLAESAAPTLRPRTLVSYRMIVTKHLTPSLGRIVLSRLSPDQVQQYMNAKGAGGLAPRTVQYHHAILRRALGLAERWGKVQRNVARLVSPPRVERHEVEPLTPAQAKVLLAALTEDRLTALYAMAIRLGLRQGELLALSWPCIDFEAGTVTVRHTLQRYDGAYHLDAPKTSKSRRTIALPAGIVAELRAHLSRQLQEREKADVAWQGDEWGLIFSTEVGTPLSPYQLTRNFQALLARLELPRQRFHDLRHAAATYMLAQGVDLRIVMEILGHSQIHVTANTYAHVKIEATRVAAEAVDALLTP